MLNFKNLESHIPAPSAKKNKLIFIIMIYPDELASILVYNKWDLQIEWPGDCIKYNRINYKADVKWMNNVWYIPIP